MNMDNYKKALNRISVREETVEKILSAAERKKQGCKIFIGRRISAVCMAAAIMLFGGAVVYAAGNNIFGMIFGDNDSANYDRLEGLTGNMNMISMETYRDDISVTPEGFASDGYNIFCVFRIDFDDPLPYAERYYENMTVPQSMGEDHFTLKIKDIYNSVQEENRPSAIGAQTFFRKAGENTLYASYRVSCENQASGTHEVDYKCYNLWCGTSPYIDEPLFYADFTVDITEAVPLEIISAGTAFDGYNISVTPCNVRIESENKSFDDFDEMFELLCGADDAYILMQDGSRVDLGKFGCGGIGDGDGCVYCNFCSLPEFPIDTENMEAFVFAGTYMTVDK